jgi:serine protease Do
VNEPNQSTSVSKSRRNKMLVGTALALVLGGALFAEATIIPQTSARAEAVVVDPVQVPSFADLAEKVSPAVVSVRVKTLATASDDSGDDGFPALPPGSPFERFFREFRNAPGQGNPAPNQQRRAMGLGSGFFISGDGYIVTNNHVVDNATEVAVITHDGAELTAKVIGRDDKTDLALLKVEGGGDHPYVTFADEKPRVGDWVVAVGNPFGLGGTVTAGIVSAQGRNIGAGPYDDYIQIDAAVNRGNSGGPTFNTRGQVIGINTAIYSPSGGSVGIAFDIPASTAKQIVQTLKDKGEVVRGWLGVQIQPVTAEIASSLRLNEPKGALVVSPTEDSPGGKAGLKAGDAIVAVDGKPVDDSSALARMIAGYAPNTTVNLTFWRDGEKKELPVTLGTMPGEQKMASVQPEAATPSKTSLKDFGIELGASDSGVVISDVDPNGKAADNGLQAGDVILDVGNKSVSSPADVEKAVESARKDGLAAVLFRVKSGDRTRYVALTFAKT